LSPRTLRNLAGGEWVDPGGGDVDVLDPASGELIARQRGSTAGDLDAVVGAASDAFWEWRMTPVTQRAAILFRYRELVSGAIDELSELTVAENGKTLDEAKGELVRGLQYIEHACAIPELMKGATSEEIGTGVDTEYIREPLGVFAIVAPFNFPAMIPLYFTWAVACGNTVVIKPSEHCPLTAVRLSELAGEAGFPPGVVNLVLGGADVVSGLAAHPQVAGLSFVGSSEVARRVYTMTTAAGKRCQSQGGSKNHLVVTDSAVVERCLPNIVSSMLGNASQRCFAGSNLLVYDEAWDDVVPPLLDQVGALRLGHGMDPSATMGPVISERALRMLEESVETAVEQGAQLLVDGRGAKVEGYPGGFWLGPTMLLAEPGMDVFDRELFGPVRCLRRVDGLDEALDIVNASTYGHTAVVYTEQGGVAREFRQRAQVGQVGVNVGTPAPIAFYPVGGRKTSLFGSHRGRANDAVDFYTDKKVVVTTWYGQTRRRAAVDPAFQTRAGDPPRDG
jgi:malonate-semialdehyde dehydrogenase (acetylating) / methylmalonate-semialdehyde dehydrogenase